MSAIEHLAYWVGWPSVIMGLIMAAILIAFMGFVIFDEFLS